MKMQTILGIMVCKVRNQTFFEKNFYAFLQKLGEERNILVYVFFPDYVQFSSKIVKGFHYDYLSRKWLLKEMPLPNFIYDRCFYTTTSSFVKYKPYVEQLKSLKGIKFLGYGLKGKWDVYNILKTNKEFEKYLPKTDKYKGKIQLVQWLKNSTIILKPIGGSHGSGVIKISQHNQIYEITGRNHKNEKIKTTMDRNVFFTWIDSFVKNRPYLIQEYLQLNTSNNQPYDIRVLVQKNDKGAWETTGMAARVGDTNNITSNLHGGGTVLSVNSLLIAEHGETVAKEILKNINFLAKNIPIYLESSHGSLFELGLDLGVDKKGNVWLIEANSKPGRKVFDLLRSESERLRALSQPINYTEFLSKQSTKKINTK